jgi:hypothetical protein
MSMKNFNETIRNWMCDLLACSTVPQPTAPPCASVELGCIRLLLSTPFHSPQIDPKWKCIFMSFHTITMSKKYVITLVSNYSHTYLAHINIPYICHKGFWDQQKTVNMISLLLTGMAVTVVMLTKGKSRKDWNTSYRAYWDKQHDSSAKKTLTSSWK